MCEAGLPFVIKKTKLEDQKGFSNFGWIQGGFSAHPKVDPENADIYNIGTNFKN